MPPSLLRGVRQGMILEEDCSWQDPRSYRGEPISDKRPGNLTVFRSFDKQEEMGYIIMTLIPDPLIVRVHEAFLSLAAFCEVMFEETLG